MRVEPPEFPPYDINQLQSLIGYGRLVHLKSGGLCELCGFGDGQQVDVGLWRQLTVEHLIGGQDGGYLPRIETAVAQYFPHLAPPDRKKLATDIHLANMVSACHFCNATTSRQKASTSMEEVIAEAARSPEPLKAVEALLGPVLEHKRRGTRHKLDAILPHFDSDIAGELNEQRRRIADQRVPGSLYDFREIVPPVPSGTDSG